MSVSGCPDEAELQAFAQGTLSGLVGMVLRSAGKHRNGLPGAPNTGLNLPFTTFTHV